MNGAPFRAVDKDTLKKWIILQAERRAHTLLFYISESRSISADE